MVDKYKEEIFFMDDTDFTYIKAFEPILLYIDPLGYEVTKEEIEGYIQEILKLETDEEFGRFGTYEENMQWAYQVKPEKSAKRKIHSTTKNIMKETYMNPQEFIAVR